MILMNELMPVTLLVKSILEEDTQARNSDSILYLRVLERISKERDVHLEDLTVRSFLTSMSVLPFPPFESVRRTRQKVQATYPELASTERVATMRSENEKKYRAYALGDIDGRC